MVVRQCGACSKRILTLLLKAGKLYCPRCGASVKDTRMDVVEVNNVPSEGLSRELEVYKEEDRQELEELETLTKPSDDVML